jgi:hypothetical protein
MGLKVMGNSVALDVEGSAGRLAGMDRITFEHDGVVSRPRESERGRESRDATPGDDELHVGGVSWPASAAGSSS